jgi:hypothetical protein
VKTFLRGVSTHAEMRTKDRETGTVVETMTGLKTRLPWAVMAPVQMASALPEALAEAEKGP